MSELGGPEGTARALLEPGPPGVPEQFVAAAEKCGVGFMGLPAGVPPGGETLGGPAQGMLAPVGGDDPQAFITQLSPDERSCLDGQDIGPQDLAAFMAGAGADSADAALAIVDCLSDDTLLPVFLTSLIGQREPLSEGTSQCIVEGFAAVDIRGLLAPGPGERDPAMGMATGMAALLVSVACMNDAEWEEAGPRLGMQPEDRQGAQCLINELGGPWELVWAMQYAAQGEVAPEFRRASEECGLGSLPPSG